MTSNLADWTRPYWHASDATAALLFFVFGNFADSDGVNLPEGIELSRHAHAALREWDGYPLAGSLGEVFAEEAPQTLAAARQTREVLRVAGDIRDPATLNYLRDTLDVITGLLETGGVAVVDPMTSTVFDAATWRSHFLNPVNAPLRQHVLVLCDPDPADPEQHWIHTRGMRKFARPDLSLTGIPGSAINQAGALCQQLLDMLALGGHFADGQALTVDGIGTLVARLGGDADDPRFFNQHVELRWP